MAEGWRVVGFDIERHVYGEHKYPAQLVIQDVLTLHGSQFKNADLIVASPPCQAYSYRAMPWKIAKALSPDEVGVPTPAWWGLAEFSTKSEAPCMTRAQMVEWHEWRHKFPRQPPDNTLFESCFRIQREACAAAGQHIPLVVENVRGAQKWVGRARWNFGSFYLWGDVPALMPPTLQRRMKSQVSCSSARWSERVAATPEEAHAFHYKLPTGIKGVPHRTKGHWTNPAEHEGVKAPGSTQWFNDGPRTPESLASSGSKSPARKFASAMIAKIPLPLSRHIAATYYPR